MAQPTILLVDDAPANIQILGAALKDIGRVRFATDGPKALDLARSAPPDLVFLDLVMPGMDGLAVCRALKTEVATASAPVIFVTGEADAEAVDAILAAGAFDVMPKPIIAALVRRRAEIALAAAGPASPAPPVPAAGARQVLVVEDGAVNRRIIGEILAREGHGVTEVATGSEAIARAGEQPFDCILLDIHLPDMTGIKVAQRLRAGGSLAEGTRIIAVTGDVTAENVADYRRSGFDDVSPKPVEPQCLLAQVRGERVDLSAVLPSAPEPSGPDLLILPERVVMLGRTYAPERLTTLFAMFEKEVRQHLDTLRRMREDGAVTDLPQTAHRLKSVLGHFGCARMQAVAHTLSHDPDMPAAEQGRLIDLLHEQFPPTLAALSGALDLGTASVTPP